ncbi:MAG: Serine/threonine-protein kinase PknD [Gammaproteobacteria bacterium]|nr:Serine/threonine-protein kinase PknD [Gammaproteobacteria bacterium]
MFNRPEGIAIDDEDNLYVNVTKANQIVRITPNQETTVLVDGKLNQPDGICYCKDYNGLFVTEDQKKGNVFYVRLDGSMTTIIKNLNEPQGVVCDKHKNLYISEQGKDRILKIAAKKLDKIINHQKN